MGNRRLIVRIKALFLAAMMMFVLASSTFASWESGITTICGGNSKTAVITTNGGVEGSPKHTPAQGNAGVFHLHDNKTNAMQKIKNSRTTFYWKCSICGHLEKGGLLGMFKMAFHYIGHILNDMFSTKKGS